MYVGAVRAGPGGRHWALQGVHDQRNIQHGQKGNRTQHDSHTLGRVLWGWGDWKEAHTVCSHTKKLYGSLESVVFKWFLAIFFIISFEFRTAQYTVIYFLIF